MTIIYDNAFLIFIVMLVNSLIYLSNQTEISIKVYSYMGYILLASLGIFISICVCSNWITGQGMTSFALFVYICAHSVFSVLSIFYILKKYFQCEKWYPRILFSLLTIFLYDIPTAVGLVLVVILYRFH